VFNFFDQINTELVKISYYPIKSLYDENGNQSNLPRGCLRDTFDVNIKLKIYKPNDKSDFIEIRDSQNNLIAEGKYEVSEIDNQEIKLPKGSVVLVKYSYVLQLPKQVSNCKYLKRSSVIINGNGGIVTTDEGTNSNSPLIVGDAKIIGDTAWDIDFLSENNITTYVFGKGYVTNKIFGPDFTDATFVNNPVTINGSFGFVLN